MLLILISLLSHNYTLKTVSTILLWVVITGGFHLDGVADVFDALGSLKDRKRAFEIMSDSRVGAIGAISISLALIFKFFFNFFAM